MATKKPLSVFQVNWWKNRDVLNGTSTIAFMEVNPGLRTYGDVVREVLSREGQHYASSSNLSCVLLALDDYLAVVNINDKGACDLKAPSSETCFGEGQVQQALEKLVDSNCLDLAITSPGNTDRVFDVVRKYGYAALKFVKST
jgi:hypothetical protein